MYSKYVKKRQNVFIFVICLFNGTLKAPSCSKLYKQSPLTSNLDALLDQDAHLSLEVNKKVGNFLIDCRHAKARRAG